MLHSKLSRHSLAFGLIVFTSIALYPAAQGEKNNILWLLLALSLSVAILTLKEK